LRIVFLGFRADGHPEVGQKRVSRVSRKAVAFVGMSAKTDGRNELGRFML
jgi:hypothetical protein